MSDRSEEEYLDELLKSMSFETSDEDEDLVDDDEAVEAETVEDEEVDIPESEVPEMEFEIPEENSPEIEIPEFNMDIPEEIIPETDIPESNIDMLEEVIPEPDIPELDIEDDVDSKLLNQLLINESDDADAEDMEIDDLLKALQEEEMAATKAPEPVPEPSVVENDNEEIVLDDDFSLDDLDMDIDPSTLFADDFSDLLAFSGDTGNDDSDNKGEDGQSHDKKSKKKKSKKDDKESNSKLKKFIMAFDDGEDEPVSKKKDTNKALMNEVFGEEEQEKKDPKAEKKAKAEEKKAEKAKKKEHKKLEKKKKAELKQAEKMKNMDLDSQVVISFGRIIRVVLIVAAVSVIVILSSRFLSYVGDINSSKKLFNSGSYTAAYERINGLKIKDRDEYFYMQARTMASLYQGLESYDNYMKIDNETMAISALVKTVARRYDLQEEITKYEVVSQAESVYNRIINILSNYGISEDEALSLNSMTNYEEYIAKISSYGGNA